MTVISASGTSSSSLSQVTRTGHNVVRGTDTNHTAVVLTANTTAGTQLRLWNSPSPYTTWTDGGSSNTPIADAGAPDGSPGCDIGGNQLSSPTNTAIGVAPSGGVSGGADAEPYYSTWSGTAFNTLHVAINTSTQWATFDYTGPGDVCYLPNGHIWTWFVDYFESHSNVYSSGSGVIVDYLLAGLLTSPTATAFVTTNSNIGNTRNLLASSINNPTNVVITKIGYNGTSSYTLFCFFSDGAGNLKYYTFSDGTVLPTSITGPTTLISTLTAGCTFNCCTDTAGNLHVVAETTSGISYWYVAAGGTTFSSAVTVSSSTNDTEPTITAFGSSNIAICYRHYTGTANKYNLSYVTAAISSSPTFSASTDFYTDSGTNNANWPSSERVSSDGTSMLTSFMTGTSNPFSVNAILVTPTFSTASPYPFRKSFPRFQEWDGDWAI